MSATAIVPPSHPLFDEVRLAVAGSLARYSGPTRVSYSRDLRQFFAWCARVDLSIFELKPGHLEVWARCLNTRLTECASCAGGQDDVKHRHRPSPGGL
jgi:hypothetical protein